MVGSFLVQHGISVQMAPGTDIESKKDRATTPDITANGRRIEVKSTRERTLPKLVALDSVRSWSKKLVKPDYYILVSKNTWRMVWTTGNNHSDWETSEAFGKPYYHCKRELFRPISELVLELQTPNKLA